MSKTQAIGSDLTTGSAAGALLRFSLPFMLANLLQTMYGLVDTVIVGQFIGSDALSAVSTCGELVTMYTCLATGFASAGQTIIGQLVGAGNTSRISRTIGTMFTSLTVLALAVSVLNFSTWQLQFSLVQLPEEAIASGREYFLICSAGMIFIFGYNMVAGVLRGLGDSKRPLVFVAVTSVVNLILDLIFVPVLHMGAAGAALATVMGQAVSFIISVIYLYRRRDLLGFEIHRRDFRFDRSLTGSLFRLGIPMSAHGILIWASVLYVCSQVNMYGVAASAANGIGTKLNSLIRIVSTSMNLAASAMIAQCIGAGKQDRVRQVVWLSGAYTLIASFFFSAVTLLFPRQIFGLFTNDEEVMALAFTVILFGVIDYIGSAVRIPFLAVVNGTGAAGLSMLAGIADGIVARIGLAFLFGNVLGMGLNGYWLGNALAGFCGVFVSAPYYFSGAWKKKKLITDETK